MPNIEMHGIRPDQNHEQHQLISKRLEGAKYRDDVVVTMVDDYVYDLQGISRPFLRLIFAKDDPAKIGGVPVYDDCLKRLVALKMDIEVVIIHKFIPKKG